MTATPELLYVLEKVKAACASEFGVFHTWAGSEDHEACRRLQEDGLIRLYLHEKETGHSMWKLP